jgi:hypothetical protein
MNTNQEARLAQITDLLGGKLRLLGIRARDPNHPMHAKIEWCPKTGLPVMPDDDDESAALMMAALDEPDVRGHNGECSFCGDRLNEPYLQWEATPVSKDAPASNVISICKKCCLRCGKGLRADLIQIEAIAEIEEIRRKAEHAKREDAELMRQMKISSLRRSKQNETDEEFDIRMDNIKYELEEQGGGCMMAAPRMRSDED